MRLRRDNPGLVLQEMSDAVSIVVEAMAMLTMMTILSLRKSKLKKKLTKKKVTPGAKLVPRATVSRLQGLKMATAKAK